MRKCATPTEGFRTLVGHGSARVLPAITAGRPDRTCASELSKDQLVQLLSPYVPKARLTCVSLVPPVSTPRCRPMSTRARSIAARLPDPYSCGVRPSRSSAVTTAVGPQSSHWVAWPWFCWMGA